MSESEDIRRMDQDGWKKRLASGIKAKGKSQRAVSLASGNGPGYVNSLIKGGKDPTIANLIAVCEAADLSLIHVLFGFSMDRQTEEIVAALSAASDRRRENLLGLLQGESDQVQPASAPTTSAASG